MDYVLILYQRSQLSMLDSVLIFNLIFYFINASFQCNSSRSFPCSSRARSSRDSLLEAIITQVINAEGRLLLIKVRQWASFVMLLITVSMKLPSPNF